MTLKVETAGFLVFAIFAMAFMLRRSIGPLRRPRRQRLPREQRHWAGLTRRAIVALRARRP